VVRDHDISVVVEEGMLTWPDDPVPRFEEVRTLPAHSVRVTRLTLGTHTGTHLNAPAHVLPRGTTVDALDLRLLCGPCRVVDLRDLAGVIDAGVVRSLAPPPRERLLFRTRNSALLRAGRVTDAFIHLAPGAAAVLADRRVRLVGLDCLTVERAPGPTLPVHATLLAAGVAVLETVDLSDVEEGPTSWWLCRRACAAGTAAPSGSCSCAPEGTPCPSPHAGAPSPR
jgi:arylformamidase